MAGVWVRYVYLLLQNTMHYCTENKKMSITALRGTQQRAALRTVANMLRAHCNLPRHDTVYEPSDAVQIVRQLEEQSHELEEQSHEAVDTDAVSEVGLSVEQGDGKKDDNSGSDVDEETLLSEEAEAEALAGLIYHDYGDLLSTVPVKQKITHAWPTYADCFFYIFHVIYLFIYIFIYDTCVYCLWEEKNIRFLLW